MNLGPRIPPAKPKPKDRPEWERVDGKPHLEKHRDTGQLRTCAPLPPTRPAPLWLDQWNALSAAVLHIQRLSAPRAK